MPIIKTAKVATYQISPEQFDLPRASLTDLEGGSDAEASAEMMKGILKGEPGARRDMVLLNAGAALMASGAAPDIAERDRSGRGLYRLGQSHPYPGVADQLFEELRLIRRVNFISLHKDDFR